MSDFTMQQLIEAVEASILPGGLLVLSVFEDTSGGITATVGKIGQVGEWQGTGATPEEALHAAVMAAEEDA